MLRAGSLRHRIDIMSVVDTKSEYGDNLKTEVLKSSTRCSIMPLSGTETYTTGIENALSHKITVNGKTDVNPTDVIYFGDRKFDIIYVIDWNEQHMEKTLLCNEDM